MENLFCSRSRRSHTNNVSNLVVLGAINLRRDLIPLVEGRLDAQRLPEVLHEFSHHFCLSGPVGNALSLLNLQSQRSAWDMNELQDNPSAAIFAELYARFQIGSLVLRPLFEGVALFSEFDSHLDKNDRFSTHATFARALSSRFYDSPFGDDLLSMKLQMVRAETIDKKSDLFASPLRNVEGGYLLGYTLIRSVWRQAVARDSFFASPSKFLSYLEELMFWDYSLVPILFGTSQQQSEFRGHEFAAQIASHVVSKLKGFFDSPKLRRSREIAESRNETPPGSAVTEADQDAAACAAYSTLHGNTGADARLGLELLRNKALALSLDLSHGDNHTRRAFPNHHVATFNRRRYFWLGSLPVSWECLDGIVTITGDGITFFDVPLSTLEPGTGEGSLEVAFLTEQGRLFVVLVTPGRKAILNEGTMSGEQLADVVKWFDSRPRLESFDSEMAAYLEASIGRVVPTAAWSRLLDEARDSADNILRPAAIQGLASRSRELLLAESRDHGLLGFLGNPNDVRLLASVSFLTASSPSLEHFKESLGKLGSTLNDVILANKLFEEKFGGELVSISDERVSSFF